VQRYNNSANHQNITPLFLKNYASEHYTTLYYYCARKSEYICRLKRKIINKTDYNKNHDMTTKKIFLLCLTALLMLYTTSAAGQETPLKHVSPEKVGMDSQRLLKADSIIEDAIQKGDIPGAVLAVVRHGKMAYLKAYGNRQVWPVVRPMTTNTVFDMASCSKAMSTALSALILCEEGKFRMLDAVNRYIPGFENWKDASGETTIRIHHLMTHTSGLPAYYSPAADAVPNPDATIEHISHMKRAFKPGTGFRYSCLNFITLQRIIETISGMSLREFSRQHIFGPLGMNHTDYIPCAPDAEGVWHNTDEPCWAALMPDGEDWRSIVAPTTRQAADSVLCGMVHDPLARIMNGGISGNAGLFSSAEDIAILCAMLQNEGTWNGQRILSKQAARLLRTVPRFAEPFGRTYGWDCYSDYASCKGDLFSPQAYCHTGFTGTGIVIDPELDCSVILLTNSVHPDEGGSTIRLRSIVSNAIAASIVE
jgi:CubicO group peptidase (beta-lactamase class C family)